MMRKPEDCLKCNQGRDCPNLPIQYAGDEPTDWPWTFKLFLWAVAIVSLINSVSIAALAGRMLGGEW